MLNAAFAGHGRASVRQLFGQADHPEPVTASTHMYVRVWEWRGPLQRLAWYLGPLFTSVGYNVYFVLCRVVPVACVCAWRLSWCVQRSQCALTRPFIMCNRYDSVIRTESPASGRSKSVLRRYNLYFYCRRRTVRKQYVPEDALGRYPGTYMQLAHLRQ